MLLIFFQGMTVQALWLQMLGSHLFILIKCGFRCCKPDDANIYKDVILFSITSKSKQGRMYTQHKASVEM